MAWGDVGIDEMAAHGQVERGSDDHVDLVHGLGSEAGSVASAGGGELVVEPVEVVGPEAAERNVTDRRVYVVVDHPRVAHLLVKESTATKKSFQR